MVPFSHPAQIDTPILIGHGKNDEVVPVESSKLAFKLLKNQGANVSILITNGGHKIAIEYLRAMRKVILSEELISWR